VTKRLHTLKYADEIGKEHPLPDIDSQAHIFDFTALLVAQIHKSREQSWGQVINAEISRVLEAIEGMRLS
jgi:hypothetical protein